MQVKLLSGGAANRLVAAATGEFENETGHRIEAEFSAVGAMAERVRSGEAVDLVILTRTVVDALAAEGLVDPATITDVQEVATGIAARAGVSRTPVADAAALRAALEAADAIYAPDMERSTAGMHFAKVLHDLGIAETVADRLRTFANGQTAMAAMAAGWDRRPIGCTQVTEIDNTPGVDLCGVLPTPHALSTTYTGAIVTGSKASEPAAALLRILKRFAG